MIQQAHRASNALGVHRIRSLRLTGGFLDSACFDFASGLNCLIGARGTGKTTALELVRYTLDSLPDTEGDGAERRRIESLVQRNLAGGQTELEVETKEGLSFVVTRAWGEEPIVLSSDRKPTEVTLRAGSVFQADIFSQNEVERIADQTSLQLALLDGFEAAEIAGINAALRQLRAALAANASQILPVESRLTAINEEARCLPAVEAKLQAFSSAGGDDSSEVNRAHFLKALRDREQRLTSGISDILSEVQQRLAAVRGRVLDQVAALEDREVAEGPNGKLVQAVTQAAIRCGEELDRLLDEGEARLAATQREVLEQGKGLALAHKEQELVFRSLMAKHQQAQGQAVERARLEKARNDLLAKRRLQDDLTHRLETLRAERKCLLEDLSELQDRRFAVRRRVAEQLNNSLAPAIRVSVIQYGNAELYQSLLENALRGARLRHGVVAGKVVGAFWPAELARIVQEKDMEALVGRAELNYEQAEKAITALSSSETLFELESVELLDLPRIELRDGQAYKDCAVLSTGQKCTAILPILLLDSDRPLLIDQPEDNLDNRFIFETVVESIRKIKRRRQLIFVTHNPNIPVLGEAEKVFVLDSNGASGRKANEGTVDQCKAEIVTLLEGGEEAFKRRKARYAY